MDQGRNPFSIDLPLLRKTQEGCGGLRGENPGAFPKAGPILQQPFSLLESAQTLAGIAFGAAGKLAKNFPAASKFAGKLFQQGSLDSHSILEFSETWTSKTKAETHFRLTCHCRFLSTRLPMQKLNLDSTLSVKSPLQAT